MVDEGDAEDGAETVTLPPEVPGYELGALLARGGTSEVWAGVALDGGRRVAVKLVRAELDALEVASREAAVSARSASAHVVPVEACVPLPDDRVAVVMPHLLGGAVDALVRARGHLSPGEVVTVLAPVASALGRLHDLGVVHGDVSPGNVLLDLDGRPLLGDLGLGHVTGDVSPGVWGTDGYVAPEVLLGADPTPASDVYALGAVGWLCLTGTVPGPPGLRPELSDICLAGEGSAPVVSALALAVGAEPEDRPSAHELAWLLFAAAEPEPLRLVHGDDEVSAVTYRLRAAAGRPPVGPEPRWWLRPLRRRPGAVATGLDRAAAPTPPAASRARTVGPARHGHGVVRRGWGLRDGAHRSRSRTVSAALALVVLALVVITGVVLGRGGSTVAAGSAPAPGPARSDPRTDAGAPTTRARELLTVLADARASAWREATPALLLGADARGSAMAARDAADVAEVERTGLRYNGLHYTVAEVSLVSATPERAVLRARVDAGAYQVTAATGSTPRPAAPGVPVLVHLVHTEVGWRMADLRPAS